MVHATTRVERYLFDQFSACPCDGQDTLTILMSVTTKWPCSLSSFLIPVSLAVSFASSFRLCIVECDTTPVAVTVSPTWSERDTRLSLLSLLWTSHVVPFFPVRRYSSPPLAFVRQP